MNDSSPGQFANAAHGNDNGTDRDVEIRVKRPDGFKQHSTARFHISVGKDQHEHPQFSATLTWGLKNFDRLIICVNDTLQRHNLIYEGQSYEDAFANAKKLGDEWVARNLKGGRRQSPRIEVKRWSDWTSRDEYLAHSDRVADVYNTDHAVRAAVEAEVQKFWERMQRREGMSGAFDFQKFQAHSTRYLLEECAVFSIMFHDELAADVYPGGSLLPCKLFKPEDQKNSENGYTRIELRNVVPEPDKKVSPLGRMRDASLAKVRQANGILPEAGGILMGMPRTRTISG